MQVKLEGNKRGCLYYKENIYSNSRLLSTDPAAAKEVVLADKPLISEETDLLEPTLLDELICHISSLASVYHKPPTAFVEGRSAGEKYLFKYSQINNKIPLIQESGNPYRRVKVQPKSRSHRKQLLFRIKKA